MKAELIDYIEIIYNRARRRRHLGGISPEAFAQVASRGQKRTEFVYGLRGSPGGISSAYAGGTDLGQLSINLWLYGLPIFCLWDAVSAA